MFEGFAAEPQLWHVRNINKISDLITQCYKNDCY